MSQITILPIDKVKPHFMITVEYTENWCGDCQEIIENDCFDTDELSYSYHNFYILANIFTKLEKAKKF